VPGKQLGGGELHTALIETTCQEGRMGKVEQERLVQEKYAQFLRHNNVLRIGSSDRERGRRVGTKPGFGICEPNAFLASGGVLHCFKHGCVGATLGIFLTFLGLLFCRRWCLVRHVLREAMPRLSGANVDVQVISVYIRNGE